MRKYYIIILIALISCGGNRLTVGDEALKEGNYDEAIVAYQEILDNEPSLDERSEVKDRIAAAYFLKGNAAYKKNDIDQAILNFQRSDNKFACEKLATIYFNKGNDLFSDGKYTQALENYKSSIQYSDKGNSKKEIGIDEKMAESYFQLGEKEYSTGKYDKAQPFFQTILDDYNAETYSKYPDILFRMFIINYSAGADEKALSVLKNLLEISPNYPFNAQAKEIFDKMLARLTKAADAQFKTKNFEGARTILEQAAVLPNFDVFKQKQFKARIIFEEGKNLIMHTNIQDGLARFEQAKEVDLNIGTEVNNWVNMDFIRASRDLQKKKDFQTAVDKLLAARQIVPENKDLLLALPDAYYELANALFNKKDYKACLAAIRSGLELNKEHKNLKALYTKWDNVVNSLKNSTRKELPIIVSFVEEQYKNAVAADLLLGKYKGKKVKWQARVLGMDESGGKSYGKFQLDNVTFYGLPGPGLDAQRFAASCEESKEKMEAVIDGEVSSVEELLGIKYIVLNISAIKFVEPLE